MEYRLFREFFRAVASPARFAVIERLRQGPASVGDLAKALSLEQSHVSHALACLLQCGFVLRSPDGKQRIYRLNPETEDILAKVEHQLSRYAGELEQCEVLRAERRPNAIRGLLRATPPPALARTMDCARRVRGRKGARP